MNLSTLLKDYGTILIFVLQIGWFLVAWWFKQSVATKDDIGAIDKKIGDVVNRVTDLETAAENAPDANDMAALRLEMSHHTGQMREFSATFNGKCDTLDAKFDGLHGFLQRAESMVSTLTRHLLDKGV